MFEITGSEISALGDADLRSLIARLAIAEARAKGQPRSSITAGGNQDAPDGGLDVRVEYPADVANLDFVPRRLTGFQVKKPDMPPSAIREEMRPKGILRDVLRDLAASSGAYVIVSSQGSVADKPLTNRKRAMRDALCDLPNAAQLHTDFYDRDRLATWVNEYPGILTWVRSKIGRPLSGWSGIKDWSGLSDSARKPYLSDGNACLIDERSRARVHLTIAEGIVRLREGLRIPRQCIRLIGLSGLGKTRLVEALFEEGVGDEPLDSSLAIYTDFSEATNPTAREMARELIAQGQRAILVVDNCNPSTHSELTKLCSSDTSQVSLLTVEYDVREDEPEQTDVFRLQSASAELVTEWLKQTFPEVSQVDRGKIAEFSGGNFRVARALAETLGKGETLGSLKSRELFERIFRQRNDPDRQLLQAAEDLALLYSIEGEDMSADGELVRVAFIRSISSQQLYEALVEMHQRGVVQSRGRFRAILPQAIANPLAAHGLERIPPARFDDFCRMLSPRMLKSVSRRLGFLHDSTAASATVERWLNANGPLGDLLTMGEEAFRIIANIAPVAPHLVLSKLEAALAEPESATSAFGRHSWGSLIKAIGYEPALFDRAAAILAHFSAGEPESNNVSSARNLFSEYFHIYLSGTQAPPAQRRMAIRRFATSQDERLRTSAQIALRALLKSDHFMSSSGHDFGARSRDWGWQPQINQDIWDWFEHAIALVVELMPQSEARALLASELRGLWHMPICRDALDRIATDFAKTQPWIEGWIACRTTLRFDGKDMPADVRSKLEQMIDRLEPLDLLNRARAVILNRIHSGLDFVDGENSEEDASLAYRRADDMAQEIGRALSQDTLTRHEFIPELFGDPTAQRAYECGQGLADGAIDLDMLWGELTRAYDVAEPTERTATVLGGFISEAQRKDPIFTSRTLESASHDPKLLPIIPYLQARAGLGDEGIERLRNAVSRGALTAQSFRSIANGSVESSPAEPLAALLADIATLADGGTTALEILHMYFFCRERDKKSPISAALVRIGRELLTSLRFAKEHPMRDYSTGHVIRICLSGEDGRSATKEVCEHVLAALESYTVFSRDLRDTLKALFEVHPFIALDVFLLPTLSSERHGLIDSWSHRESPLDSLALSILKEWANVDPDLRYPALGGYVRMFGTENGDEKNVISPRFVSLLEKAPDKRLFIGEIGERLHPRSWSGSLASILTERKAQLLKLAESTDDQTRGSINEITPELELWIERERGRDRAREESFE